MDMGKLLQSMEKHGWTQQDLVDKTGFFRDFIVSWETGKREPKFDELLQLISKSYSLRKICYLAALLKNSRKALCFV